MPSRPLRVAIDGRSLNVEHLRGIGKTVHELIRRTSASGAVQWRVFGDRPDLPMHVPDPSCEVSVFETRGYRFALWEQYSLPAAARHDADLLHAPALTAPWWQPLPTVVTVHDTIPWQSADSAWPAGFYRDHLLPAVYHRASAIITISNTSRRDILARWPALQPKLYVVSPGVHERYLDAAPDRRPILIGDRVVSEPYLLYVGGAEPRKRLMWGLQAWWNSRAAATSSMVVCGLEAAAHERIRRSVPRHVQDRLILAPFVDEEEMPRLYMRATAVLYPSLYEGFGMPVVEAQAVGTPVLFSDVGSLAELKGPGAVILPVDDLSAWVRVVDLLLQSRSPKGPDRVARAWAGQYSWDAFTERTLEVYHTVAERARPAVGVNSPTPTTHRTSS